MKSLLFLIFLFVVKGDYIWNSNYVYPKDPNTNFDLYTVRYGDTLQSIATQIYRDKDYWNLLKYNNQNRFKGLSIKEDDQLPFGMTLSLPPKEKCEGVFPKSFYCPQNKNRKLQEMSHEEVQNYKNSGLHDSASFWKGLGAIGRTKATLTITITNETPFIFRKWAYTCFQPLSSNYVTLTTSLPITLKPGESSLITFERAGGSFSCKLETKIDGISGFIYFAFHVADINTQDNNLIDVNKSPTSIQDENIVWQTAGNIERGKWLNRDLGIHGLKSWYYISGSHLATAFINLRRDPSSLLTDGVKRFLLKDNQEMILGVEYGSRRLTKKEYSYPFTEWILTDVEILGKKMVKISLALHTDQSLYRVDGEIRHDPSNNNNFWSLRACVVNGEQFYELYFENFILIPEGNYFKLHNMEGMICVGQLFRIVNSY